MHHMMVARFCEQIPRLPECNNELQGFQKNALFHKMLRYKLSAPPKEDTRNIWQWIGYSTGHTSYLEGGWHSTEGAVVNSQTSLLHMWYTHTWSPVLNSIHTPSLLHYWHSTFWDPMSPLRLWGAKAPPPASGLTGPPCITPLLGSDFLLPHSSR